LPEREGGCAQAPDFSLLIGVVQDQLMHDAQNQRHNPGTIASTTMLEMPSDKGTLNPGNATSPASTANAQRNAGANPMRSARRPLASGPSIAPTPNRT
jgi:hypothetical protein